MLQNLARLLLLAAVTVVGFYVLDGRLAFKYLAILLAVPVILWGLSRAQKLDAGTDANGWRRLRPAAMHWVGLFLSAGLTALLLYVYLFVGSTRADAAQQTTILLGLIAAFGASSVAMAVICCHTVVRWNEERIESWLGPWQRGAISWRELAQAEHAGPGTPLVLESAGGLRLKIDATLDGAEELLQRVTPWITPRTFP